ncbi:9091_t:CDS:2, partial [Entrophospora sp. SA101]
SIDKNTLKQILIYLRKNTELLVETNKIVKKLDSNYTKLSNELEELKKRLTIWKSATRKLLKNGYIYPNETGFKDYFISVINEQYDSKKKKRSTTPSNSKSHEKYFAKIYLVDSPLFLQVMLHDQKTVIPRVERRCTTQLVNEFKSSQ